MKKRSLAFALLLSMTLSFGIGNQSKAQAVEKSAPIIVRQISDDTMSELPNTVHTDYSLVLQKKMNNLSFNAVDIGDFISPEFITLTQNTSDKIVMTQNPASKKSASVKGVPTGFATEVYPTPTLGDNSGYELADTAGASNTGIPITQYTYNTETQITTAVTKYLNIKQTTYNDGSAQTINYAWDSDTKTFTATTSGNSIMGSLDGTTMTGDFIGNPAGYVVPTGVTAFTSNFIGNTNGSGLTAGIQNIYEITSIKGNFIGNKNASYGGAIYNDSVDSYIGKIGTITGDFIGNNATENGGAIFNDYNKIDDDTIYYSEIGTITGDFIANKADKYGGAILNHSKIGTINGNFVNNYSVSNSGGAIYNTGEITSINSNFFNNNAVGTNNTSGGAIWNNGTIGDTTDISKAAISGIFKGNIAKRYGGAIYNGGRITKITGTFGGTGEGEGNTAYYGGAIYNTGSYAIIDSINATFINNSASNGTDSGSGSAIYNDGIIGDTGDITKTAIAGTFKGNNAVVNGGAIFSYNHGIITKIDATFGGTNASDGNIAERGGAIYNGSDIYSINGTFKNNSATGNKGGGAIYNYVEGRIGIFDGDENPDLTKTAISGTFEGNSAVAANSSMGGAIFNDGGIITKIANATFTGNTSSQGSAIANFDYYSNLSTAKIYSIDGTFINNTASNVGGAILNGSTIGDISGTFKGNEATGIGTGTYHGHGGAIHNDEGKITRIDAIFGGTGTGEGNTAKAGGAICNIGSNGSIKEGIIYSINGTFTNNIATEEGGGAIYNANNTAIIGDRNNLETTAISGTFKGNKATGTDGIGGAIYNNGKITKIDATFGGANASDGNTAVNGGAIYNDENGNIGYLSGTFTSNKATSKGGAIYNRQIVSLVADSNNVIFEKNTDGNGYNDIHQYHTSYNSTLNLNANTDKNITFNGTITGDGTSDGHNVININKGSSNVGGSYIFNNGVSGNDINIYNGANIKLGSKTQADSSKTYGSYTLGSLTNDTHNGTIDMQNEKYNDANNFGKLALGSALNIKLDIDASTTTPTSDTIAVASGSSGVLNINSIYLKGIGSNLSTIASKVADGTVKDFTLQVLSGNNANSYLTIDSDLKNAFHNESISTDEYTEDIMPTSNSINWNSKYGEYTYKIKTTKDINIYGGTGTTNNGLKNALKFATTESHYDEHTTNQADNLAVINTYSGTGSDNRRIRFNGIHTDAHGVYTMMANTALGETTAGTMTLAGVMSTGANPPVRTTVDLNNNAGYDLTNASTIALTNINLTGASNAPITVSNTSAGVTLNNSIVDGDIDGSALGISLFDMTTSNTSGVTGDVSNANIVNSGDLTLGGNVSGAIQNTKTLTLQGATLDADITGTGTDVKTVIDGDVELTAGKTIAQAVEINSGKSLTTATTGLTGTSDIKNGGALVFNNTANGTIAQNIVKNATGGTVEIAAADGIKIALAAGKAITDNSLTLTSGIFDATNRADTDGNIDFTNASTGLGSGLIAEGGTLSVQDDKQGAINLGAVNTDNSALSIAIDAQFTTGEYEEDVFVGTADKITATISNSNNKIDVSNIKITADPVATTFKAQIADAASTGNISLSAATLTGLSAQAGSVLLGYDSATGYLKGGNSDLDNAITSTIPVKVYSIGDEIIGNDSGALTLGGTSLSITGNDKTIISTSNTEGGIVIDNNGQTLSIAGAGFGSNDNYFTTAIDNTVGGTINLTDVTFNANNTTAVANNGTGEKGLFLNGTNEFNSGITGTGKTNVVGGTTTFNTDVMQSNLEIKAPATLVNNEVLTVAEAIVNNGALTNNNTIASNSLDNVGTVTNYGGSTITVNTNINNYGENGDIENAGSILAQNINNAATVNNANGGTITATDTFGNSNVVNNNGDILANALNNTGAFSNFADGNVTVNTTILNDTNGTFDNAGNVLSLDIVNNGSVNNFNGGTITATGTLTNTNTFNTDGEVNANSFGNTGALTNYENGVINVNETFANYGENADIKNLGKINSKDINNASTITNYGNAEITATNDFINSGALTNLADAKLTVLNKLTNLGENGDIENAGTILAAEIENAATVNNANGGSITATGKLTNSNIFNSNGDVAADSMDNTGTFTNYADGTVTVNTTINNYGNNAVIDNAGDILANTINNAATVNNANGGTITATDTFGNSNVVNNNGDILANALNNTGTFSNFADGNVTVNTTILNDTNGTFDNAGNVLSLDIVNNGIINNENGANIIATNNINNINEFNTDGNVSANTVDNSGIFTNTENGVVDVADTFNNTNKVNNSGVVNADTFANATGATLTNDGIVNAIENFNNDGDVNNNSEGKGILNIKNGYSNGSVTQGIINIAADNTAFDNNAEMAVEQLLNNYGTLNNTSDINVANSTNDALLDNSGVINAKADSTITANVLRNTNATINMAKSKLTVTNQTEDISGTVNIKGTDAANDVSEMAVAGVNPVFAGVLNVGDNDNKSTLKFLAGDIDDAAEVNIAKGNVLNVAQDTSKGEEAYVVLNENDTFNGDVVLDNGTVEMKNVSYTTGDKSTTNGSKLPYYEQNGGNLGLTNATLTMKDASLIDGGSMLVGSKSTFNSQENGFNVENLANGGLVNAVNNDYENYGISNNLYAGDGMGTSKGDFTIDLYMRSNADKKYDSFGGSSTKMRAANGKEGTLHISDWAIHGDLMGADAPTDRSITLDHLFGGEVVKGHKIHFTSTDKEVLTPIAWYKLASHGDGNYAFEVSRWNPDVFRGQITKLAQYQNQLAIDDMLFNHSMLDQGFKGNDTVSSFMANRYASANDMFAPYQYSRKDGGVWVKSYANFEKLNMNHGLNVGNNSYGTIIGADFGLKELRKGWAFMPTAYIGYNGAHQYWHGTGAYQNGGQLGFMGTWYKDDFMIGALAYGGVYGNEMDTMRGHDETFNYFAGGSAKAAYNWKFHKDWSLQPNFLVAYNFFGQENWHTDFGQMGMMSGMLHGINVAPGLNLIWEKETFSTYLTLQYMYNVNQSVGGRAGNADLPRAHMDRGYIQYGIGVNKKFTENFSGYAQTVIRNVGRNGVGFQLGFNWLLGSSKAKNAQAKSSGKTVIKKKKKAKK